MEELYLLLRAYTARITAPCAEHKDTVLFPGGVNIQILFEGCAYVPRHQCNNIAAVNGELEREQAVVTRVLHELLFLNPLEKSTQCLFLVEKSDTYGVTLNALFASLSILLVRRIDFALSVPAGNAEYVKIQHAEQERRDRILTSSMRVAYETKLKRVTEQHRAESQRFNSFVATAKQKMCELMQSRMEDANNLQRITRLFADDMIRIARERNAMFSVLGRSLVSNARVRRQLARSFSNQRRKPNTTTDKPITFKTCKSTFVKQLRSQPKVILRRFAL